MSSTTRPEIFAAKVRVEAGAGAGEHDTPQSCSQAKSAARFPGLDVSRKPVRFRVVLAGDLYQTMMLGLVDPIVMDGSDDARVNVRIHNVSLRVDVSLLPHDAA